MHATQNIDPESRMLLNLNEFIHCNNERYEYHMNHIKLVRKYAILLNKKLNAHLNNRDLSYISLAHDLFKERSLNPKAKEDIIWNGHVIPQDTTRYVRENLDILAEYDLDDYFNTDIQYHSLSAGLFLYKEFGIKNREILYPIFFHSCPIISVYKNLDHKLQNTIDIIMLADKLSSNYLRINLREVEVRVDLDQVVFGSSGKEFNYTLGLYLARLIGQGKSTEKQSKIATDYYYERLCEINPVVSKSYSIKKLGGVKLWPKRKSQVWMTH